jgi:hypothetical protein
MLHRIQAAYRYLKAEKARSDALVEEGRQIMGWHRCSPHDRPYAPNTQFTNVRTGNPVPPAL